MSRSLVSDLRKWHIPVSLVLRLGTLKMLVLQIRECKDTNIIIKGKILSFCWHFQNVGMGHVMANKTTFFLTNFFARLMHCKNAKYCCHFNQINSPKIKNYHQSRTNKEDREITAIKELDESQCCMCEYLCHQFLKYFILK